MKGFTLLLLYYLIDNNKGGIYSISTYIYTHCVCNILIIWYLNWLCTQNWAHKDKIKLTSLNMYIKKHVGLFVNITYLFIYFFIWKVEGHQVNNNTKINALNCNLNRLNCNQNPLWQQINKMFMYTNKNKVIQYNKYAGSSSCKMQEQRSI